MKSPLYIQIIKASLLCVGSLILLDLAIGGINDKNLNSIARDQFFRRSSQTVMQEEMKFSNELRTLQWCFQSAFLKDLSPLDDITKKQKKVKRSF